MPRTLNIKEVDDMIYADNTYWPDDDYEECIPANIIAMEEQFEKKIDQMHYDLHKVADMQRQSELDAIAKDFLYS